jgi:hypothetical protein
MSMPMVVIQRHPELLAAIEAIAGDRQGIINSRNFGKWVSQAQGTRLGGRWFVKLAPRIAPMKWKVHCEMTVE